MNALSELNSIRLILTGSEKERAPFFWEHDFFNRYHVQECYDFLNLRLLHVRKIDLSYINQRYKQIRPVFNYLYYGLGIRNLYPGEMPAVDRYIQNKYPGADPKEIYKRLSSFREKELESWEELKI